MGSLVWLLSRILPFTLWASHGWECPVSNPVMLRYMRIQSKPFLNQLYTHTTNKVMTSFVPHDTQALSVLQDTLYEFVENKTLSVDLDPKEVTTFLVRHFVIQAITHEVNDVVHDVVNEAVKKMTH
jgi:hypothetical protein